MNRPAPIVVSSLLMILVMLLNLGLQSWQLAYGVNLTQLQLSYKKLGGQVQVLQDWQNLLIHAKDQPVNEQLRSVNEFFNRYLVYGEDIDVWGQADYWATPMQSLAKGKGDCVAYVISKYFALRELNVPEKQLRLIYVKARIGRLDSPIQQAHMILAYYPTPDDEPLILDNLITDIRPASRRPDLQPVFSFNSEGVFVAVAGSSAVGPGGVGRLSRWADVLQRAHTEGF